MGYVGAREGEAQVCECTGEKGGRARCVGAWKGKVKDAQRERDRNI